MPSTYTNQIRPNLPQNKIDLDIEFIQGPYDIIP